MGTAGSLYGTTSFCFAGGPAGNVFKLDPSGNEAGLHSFTGGSDGAFPKYGSLLMDQAGNLYGSTEQGGAYGSGTVFKIDTSGNKTVLYSFGPYGSGDGYYPWAGVIMDKAGNLYGTTSGGGAAYSGTVFKLDAFGNETVLHSFTGPDGAFRQASLIMDSAGNLYGITTWGGAYGYGTVFKLDTSGNETVLYSFAEARGDGGEPYDYGSLVMDAAGNLYGTTFHGGAYGVGTVFKLDTSGNETVLHSFNGSDGEGPDAGLMMDAAGNLYGTVPWGGAYNKGTVFKLDTSGNEVVLCNFAGSDGAHPYAGLIMDTAGNLYGTAGEGGAYDLGTVFKIGPAFTVYPPNLNYGSQTVRTARALTAVLNNGTTSRLTIMGINITGTNSDAYSETNTCGSGVAPEEMCAINVVFKPNREGTASGSVTITDNAPDSPQVISLTGQALGKPALSASIVGKSKSGTTVTATLQLTDRGTGAAQQPRINRIDLRTLGGTGTVTLSTPTLPLSVGNLPPQASTNVTLTLNVPTTVTKFSLTEKGTLQDIAGNSFTFALAEIVYP